MKKIICMCLAFVVLCLSLGGCADSRDEALHISEKGYFERIQTIALKYGLNAGVFEYRDLEDNEYRNYDDDTIITDIEDGRDYDFSYIMVFSGDTEDYQSIMDIWLFADAFDITMMKDSDTSKFSLLQSEYIDALVEITNSMSGRLFTKDEVLDLSKKDVGFTSSSQPGDGYFYSKTRSWGFSSDWYLTYSFSLESENLYIGGYTNSFILNDDVPEFVPKVTVFTVAYIAVISAVILFVIGFIVVNTVKDRKQSKRIYKLWNEVAGEKSER